MRDCNTTGFSPATILFLPDRQRLIAMRALLYRCEVAAFVVNLRLQSLPPIRRRLGLVSCRGRLAPAPVVSFNIRQCNFQYGQIRRVPRCSAASCSDSLIA